MNYYKEIKLKLLDNEVNKKVKNYLINKSDLDTYYEVGKMLFEAGKHYGEGIIKNYSIKLINEVDKKYNITNLKRYRQFYLMIEKGAPMGHQLNWSHYRELLPIKNINEINYYIRQVETRNLTKRQLQDIIKNNEYKRLPDNVKKKLINKEEISIQESVINPIVINNPKNNEIINEITLHKLILSDIEGFMSNLGEYYSFIGSEYKIKIGNRYNYIDLLLYNYKYNCFVVIELKVTELKKEHIGQIITYMNYVDENLKSKTQNKTIGIIICKINNEFIVKYTSNEYIISREYIIKK